jgi:hypothetical protein
MFELLLYKKKNFMSFSLHYRLISNFFHNFKQINLKLEIIYILSGFIKSPGAAD